MTNYGCHNRQMKNGYYVMQRKYGLFGAFTMEQTYIKHAMTTECQHTKHNPADPRCKGCNHAA